MNKNKLTLIFILIGFLCLNLLLKFPTKAAELEKSIFFSETHRIECLKEKQLLKDNRVKEKKNIEEETILVEIEEETATEQEVIIKEETIEYAEYIYDASDLMYHGVIYAGGYRYTFYQESVLPGDGLSIPGRWSDYNTGFVRDGEGNICLASSDLVYGTIVQTPWGQGCIYDCGCSSGTLDVYLCW